MYGRTPVELLDNIFMGDIAKLSLEYLKFQCINPIIDYDELRNDNFMSPDPGWDFKWRQVRIKVRLNLLLLQTMKKDKILLIREI